jgi:hypothetical protein
MSVQQGKENPQYALRCFQAQGETAQIARGPSAEPGRSAQHAGKTRSRPVCAEVTEATMKHVKKAERTRCEKLTGEASLPIRRETVSG